MAYEFYEKKKPAEKITFSIDFEKDLDTGETISSIEVKGDAAVLDGAASYSGTVVSQKVSGGKAGRVYKIIFRPTTSSPHIIQADLFLSVVAAWGA